jgi:hypothetical protein
VKRQIKSIFIVWFALFVSQGIYLFLGKTLGAQATGTPPENFVQLLTLVAMLTVFAAVCIHAFLVRRPLNQLKGPIPDDLIAKLLPMNIISWAMVESVAVYGLLVSMMGGGFSTQLRFAMTAVGAFVFIGPWHSSFRARAPKDERPIG